MIRILYPKYLNDNHKTHTNRDTGRIQIVELSVMETVYKSQTQKTIRNTVRNEIGLLTKIIGEIGEATPKSATAA